MKRARTLGLRRVAPRAIVAGLLALVIAGFAARDALVFATQAISPEFALALDPDSPVALVQRAQMQATVSQNVDAKEKLTSDSLAEVARRSIASLPLNAAAYRLFGASQAAGQDLDRLGEQMAMANHLSRRDLGTQIFLIEDGVRRNDIASSLAAYDAALRVDVSSRAMLYPVLTEAMREPLVRRKFASYVRTPPPWMESFLRFAVSNAADPRTIAQLAFVAGGFPSGQAYSSLDTELLTALVERTHYREAVRYFRSRDASSALLRSFGMSATSTDPRLMPVTWQPYSIPGIDAAWVKSGDAVELEALLDAGYTGPVARKLVALKPGTYRVVAPFRADSFAQGDRITWSLACENGTRALSASSLLVNEGALRSTFVVPAGCTAQMLTISATTQPGSGSVQLTMTSPTLQAGP